jgi:hypothetical protein
MGSLAASLLLSGGCKSEERKQQERACSEALTGGRVALKDDHLDAARKKLAAAEASCPDLRRTYVDQLRDEIAARQAELARQREQAEAEAARRREHPVLPFMDWVRERAKATDKVSRDMKCHPSGDPRYGWCDGTVEVVKGTPFRARVWKTDTEAYRLSVTLAAPVVCDDLGPHRVVRTWTVGGDAAQKVRRTHCELLSKSYRGLAALVTVRPGTTEVDVFTGEYLERDPELGDMLRDQGR